MYKKKISIKLRCNKHPRFNPADGRAAVKGGCGVCNSMIDIATFIDVNMYDLMDELDHHDLTDSGIALASVEVK